jgi:hypothetical protein
MLAYATFEGIRAVYTFQKFYLEPMVQGLINQNPREECLIELYYRMAMLLKSLRKLNGPIHFQTIAAIARSLFELGLDIVLFSQDTSNDSVDRLSAFTRIERYRCAKKLVDYYINRPAPPNLDLFIQRQLCADAKEKLDIDSLIRQYWGIDSKGKPKWPKHWSKFQDARRRAHHVGNNWEECYVRNYYMLSWQIHPGLTGIAGLSQESFDSFVMEAFQLSTDVVLESYKIIGRELQLAKAMPEWDDRLTFLGRVIGLALVDKCLQALGEPTKFRYLEEHEQVDD